MSLLDENIIDDLDIKLKEEEVKYKICDIGKRLYHKGFIVGTDGNISVKHKGFMLITPSGKCKGILTPDQIVKIDINSGKVVEGKLKPSSEIKMHLIIYRNKDDANAIIHAHPPISVALTLVDESLEKIYLPEIAYHLDNIPTVAYFMPGSQELANSLLPFLDSSDAILLKRHGIITIADNLEKAFYKIEYVEHTAKVIWYAKQLGEIKELSREEIQKIKDLKKNKNNKNKAK